MPCSQTLLGAPIHLAFDMTPPPSVLEVITITRGPRQPITREEWAAIVAAEQEIAWAIGDQTGSLDVHSAEFALPTAIWRTGDSSCDLQWADGAIMSVSPTPEAIGNLVKLADRIGAVAINPHGVRYNLDGQPDKSGFFHGLYVVGAYAVAVFNTMFAILASVTLIGIVFITRPKQVMHNVHPDVWTPLMLIMVPAQAWCQFLTWKTAFFHGAPSPWEIARRQKTPSSIVGMPLAVLWTLNFLVGFAIVVSLYKPAPGRNNGPIDFLLIAFLTFALTRFANVYLLLAVRTLTSNEVILKRVSDWSLLVDIGIAITAVLYYGLA